MDSKPTHGLTEVKGLASYPALGTAPAPRVLRNALLWQGGWACAPAAKQHAQNVTFALWAGWGRDLYLNTSAGVQRYRNGTLTPLPSLTGAVLTDGVTLGPNLVQAGDYYIAENGVTLRKNPYIAPIQWVRPNPKPTVPYWVHEQDGPIGGDFVALTEFKYGWAFVPVLGPDAGSAPTAYNWPLLVDLPFHSQSEAGVWGLPGELKVYAYMLNSGEHVSKETAGGRWVQWRITRNPTGEYFYIDKAAQQPATVAETISITMSLAEYHLGRVYAVADNVEKLTLYAGARVDSSTEAPSTPLALPNRLYYSDVVAGFSGYTRPYWTADGYMDMPFRVSYSIVGIKSAGRHLYIFGENEVMLLNGNDDLTWNIDPLGDSIGAISPGSIQALRNTVLWLSDSGAMMAQNGQVQDISLDVLDKIKRLNHANTSSTVDYERELYIVTDGTTTLVYHLREGGWSTRDTDGSGQKLLFAGGIPWSLHDGHLYSLDSETLLTMYLTAGPFGMWGQNRTWRGVQVGVDCDTTAALSVNLHTRGMAFDTEEPTDLRTDERTRTMTPGLTPVSMALSVNGVTPTAELAEVTVTLNPGQARRCLLRPPLLLVSDPSREAVS